MAHLYLLATDKEESAITTIMIRGSTDNIMDDMERAINDGVNTFKALTRVGGLLSSLASIHTTYKICVTTSEYLVFQGLYTDF